MPERVPEDAAEVVHAVAAHDRHRARRRPVAADGQVLAVRFELGIADTIDLEVLPEEGAAGVEHRDRILQGTQGVGQAEEEVLFPGVTRHPYA